MGKKHRKQVMNGFEPIVKALYKAIKAKNLKYGMEKTRLHTPSKKIVQSP